MPSSALVPMIPTGPLRARVLASLGAPAGAGVFLVVSAVACQPATPKAVPPGDDVAPAAASPSASAMPSASTADPVVPSTPSASVAPVLAAASVTAAATTTSAPPPAVEREDPTACKTRITKCFPPNQRTSGGKVILRELHFDKNGCTPKAETAGACAAFFPTSEPRFQDGQCCYQGCPGPIIKCGRPLFRAGGPVVAALVVSATWSLPS